MRVSTSLSGIKRKIDELLAAFKAESNAVHNLTELPSIAHKVADMENSIEAQKEKAYKEAKEEELMNIGQADSSD